MWNKIIKKITAIDQFSEGFAFTVQGHSGLKTIGGAIVTATCYLLVIAYSLNQFVTMAQYGNTNFQMTLQKNLFQMTDVIKGPLN
jgi:hypothetical protein